MMIAMPTTAIADEVFMQDWFIIAVSIECVYAILNISYQYRDIEAKTNYKTMALVDTSTGQLNWIGLDFDEFSWWKIPCHF